MNIQNQAIAKIQKMPESLVQEVNDYIDFVLWKYQNQLKLVENEDLTQMAESDFSDYLSKLEEYENRLANGEIKW